MFVKLETKESIHIHVHIFNPKGGMLVFGKSCASCFISRNSVKYAIILSTEKKLKKISKNPVIKDF